VFEGRVADIVAVRGRVLLKTSDFAAAVELLRKHGVISGAADGRVIALNDGRTTAEVTKILVEAKVSVEGIWQQEQTLEDFYLSLVKAPAQPANVNRL
jgi:hypothetical protein